MKRIREWAQYVQDRVYTHRLHKEAAFLALLSREIDAVAKGGEAVDIEKTLIAARKVADTLKLKLTEKESYNLTIQLFSLYNLICQRSIQDADTERQTPSDN